MQPFNMFLKFYFGVSGLVITQNLKFCFFGSRLNFWPICSARAKLDAESPLNICEVLYKPCCIYESTLTCSQSYDMLYSLNNTFLLENKSVDETPLVYLLRKTTTTKIYNLMCFFNVLYLIPSCKSLSDECRCSTNRILERDLQDTLVEFQKLIPLTPFCTMSIFV